tara:strand:+ start:317 stop:667 length:351 start_codon:yes stop_codon:yes gene_type:complete
MAGFGLPNFGQLTEAFRKAQQIQKDAQKLQEELEEMELEGKSGDETVSIWLSGNQEPLRVKIDPSVLEEGAEATETKILEALKQAHELSTTTMKTRMEELTGGLKFNLPGIDSINE